MFILNQDEFSEQYFDMGEENFQRFAQFVNKQNALPISLSSSDQLLGQEKQMQEWLIEQKQKTRQATACFLSIAGKIVDTQLDAIKLNSDPNVTS